MFSAEENAIMAMRISDNVNICVWCKKGIISRPGNSVTQVYQYVMITYMCMCSISLHCTTRVKKKNLDFVKTVLAFAFSQVTKKATVYMFEKL